MHTAASQAQLKIYPAGRNIWRCESGQNNYKISTSTPGKYHCTCPARTECRHIKQLKSLQGIQATVLTPPPERRKADRRAGATQNNPPIKAANVEQLRLDVTALLYGFKEENLNLGQNVEIEKLRLELAHVLRLGFGGDRTFAFLNDKYNCTWYFMDGENHTPIREKFLFGYIRKIEFKARKGNVRPSHHLYLTVEADRIYTIITGYDNHFSKGLIATVAQMSPEQLRSPVWIQPQKTGLTTLCNLHQNGQLIRGRYGKEEDWKALSIQAIENLRAAST
jgi:hypothetical protein